MSTARSDAKLESRNIVDEVAPVLDYVMHFLLAREAVVLLRVCHTWKNWVAPIIDRGPFDCRMPSVTEDENELATARISEKELRENSILCEALSCGCMEKACPILRRRAINMPLYHRNRIWLKGYTGKADCFSPIQRFLASAGLMFSFRTSRDTTPTWCIFRLKDPEYFNALERPKEQLRKYAELISWNDGVVAPTDFEAAAKKPVFYNLWFEQIAEGLKMFKAEGWLHPTIPLVVYALTSMTRYYHEETVEKLLDLLLQEYSADINATRFTTGATALHELCGLYGPVNIAIPVVKMLVARGAAWDRRTVAPVEKFAAGVSPLDVLKQNLTTSDEDWPKHLDRAEVTKFLQELEAGMSAVDSFGAVVQSVASTN